MFTYGYFELFMANQEQKVAVNVLIISETAVLHIV